MRHKQKHEGYLKNKYFLLIIKKKNQNQLNQVAKSEADTFLGEVRRKLKDTKRIIELLQSLRELRVLRARSLELQRALFSKQEDTDHFNSTLGKFMNSF